MLYTLFTVLTRRLDILLNFEVMMHEAVIVVEVRVNQSTALEKGCERRMVTVVNV